MISWQLNDVVKDGVESLLRDLKNEGSIVTFVYLLPDGVTSRVVSLRDEDLADGYLQVESRFLPDALQMLKLIGYVVDEFHQYAYGSDSYIVTFHKEEELPGFVPEEISKRFDYHKPSTEVVEAMHQTVRTACKSLATRLSLIMPEGREASLAITKLEEVMFWANAAIARGNAND